MKKLWVNLKPCFIVSTGRTGTKFLTYFFNHFYKNIDARHEPHPKLLKLRYKFSAGKISLKKASNQFIRARKRIFNQIKGEFYIESNPYLSLLIPVIKNVFEDYRILHIIRDGREWLRSAMNRGVYDSILFRHFSFMIPVFRIFAYDKYSLPRYKKINLGNYIRDAWRIRAVDFKNDPYNSKWRYMSRFEKLAWFWAKINDLIYTTIKDDDKALTIRFEDLFNKEKNYDLIKKILEFFNIDSIKEFDNSELNLVFSKKINITQNFTIPRWKDWKEDWVVKFNEIAGDQMKFYGYI